MRRERSVAGVEPTRSWARGVLAGHASRERDSSCLAVFRRYDDFLFFGGDRRRAARWSLGKKVKRHCALPRPIVNVRVTRAPA